MDEIIILGGGGHALSVCDAITNIGCYKFLGYTDCMDRGHYNYLGKDDVLKGYYDAGVKNAVIGVGYLGKTTIRDRLYTMLKQIGYNIPKIIEPSAVLSSSSRVGEGTFVGKNAIVNTDTVIGKMCIINTGSIIEHSNYVGDFSHIAVGSTLCGDVVVGEHAFVGANVTVLQGIRIGMNSIIGAGSLILKDVPDNSVIKGIWGGYKIGFLSCKLSVWRVAV